MEGQKDSGDQGPKTKKRTKFLKSWREAGQLSIFLGMVLLVVTTFIAFVVNVGLFVKAKINLQNSVDAAAFAGAAVQARQLTNIGYLNWEIRNTYKEWLFKYYILGNIGLDAIDNIDGNAPGSNPSCNGNIALNNQGMNFRLRQFTGNNCRYYQSGIYDHYNVPSVCIHFGSNNNICEIVTLPGLPRFNTVGLPSISEQHEAFLNSIVQTKADDCADRSNINMGAAMLWTYGTGNANLFPGVPEIAPSRIGAWVQSLELALRMRNLEAIVNTPAINRPICRNPGNTNGVDCVSIEDIMNDGSSLPFNERPTKAFWSAFRNLSGGAFKENNESNDFSSSFRLTELDPKPFPANESSLSGFLIPSTEPEALQKRYLDLKIMPINYAMFYTSFFPATGSFVSSTPGPDVPDAEAACGGTKTAIPVPGYILGFVKNPEVVTYYAVEGAAEFTGLFYPFFENQGITLKTYAAAKPFGGRIGPLLFDAGFTGNDASLKTLSGTKRSSSNYISAFNTASIPDISTDDGARQILEGGYPIPTIPDFWITSAGSADVGGNPTVSGGATGFGIPNLIYDFENYSEISNLGEGILPINDLVNSPNDADAYRNFIREKDFGLYDIEQFRKFRDNKVGTGGAAIFSIQEITQSLHRVRRATRYESLNYMIPLMDVDGNNPTTMDGNSYVQQIPGAPPPAGDTNTQVYRLFAPLYGSETLYNSPAAITDVINRYITENSTAIQTYTTALEQIANRMRALSASSSRGGNAYLTAADTIHKLPLIGPSGPTDPECDTLSMAQKFNMFFSVTQRGCGITPLAVNTTTYFNTGQSIRGPDFQYYYRSTWQTPTFGDLTEGLSGYMPGQRQGANNDGSLTSVFGASAGVVGIAKRNFYSTKFIPMNKVVDTGTPYGFDGLPIFIDPVNATGYSTSTTMQGIRMRNTLDGGRLQEYGNPPPF
ncbi:MAG: hypothetical protein K9K67_00020 [Bacteriovoracaceae bacterium]|nr:hypothetical protein [Bacteriovoracaceae bacterium]